MAFFKTSVTVALLVVMAISWGAEAWHYPGHAPPKGGRAPHPSKAPHPIRAPVGHPPHPSRAPPPHPSHPHPPSPSRGPHYPGRGTLASLSLRLVNLTITNNLTVSTLNVTIGALPPNTPETITLAPNATGTVRVDIAAAFIVKDILKFRVNNTLYVDTASGAQGALGRFLAQTGLLKVVVSPGPCSGGRDGLVLMDYVAGVLFNDAGCALQQT